MQTRDGIIMTFFTVLFSKSPFSRISTVETERFQNDVFSKSTTFETFSKVSVFSILGRFSVNDRQKRI